MYYTYIIHDMSLLLTVYDYYKSIEPWTYAPT